VTKDACGSEVRSYTAALGKPEAGWNRIGPEGDPDVDDAFSFDLCFLARIGVRLEC
jgi:hypothetical protein